MAFDPDAYLAEKEAPATTPPPFDPDAYLKEKASEPVGFDPNKYLGNKVSQFRDDSAFDPAMHAAQTGDTETAYEVYKARKNRTAGEKAMEAGKTLLTPETYTNAAKGVWNFLTGFPQVAKNTAQQGYYSLTGDPRARTKEAEATLTAQSGEEAGKRMLDATAGRAYAELLKTSDVDPARTAYRESYLRRNPAHLTEAQLEERKAQWARDDEKEKLARNDEIDRRVFEQRVQAAKNQMRLAEGRPLDTGIISKIYEAGGQVPSQEVGPEALKAAGAEQANLGNVERMAAATDPNNIALAVAPSLPGASKIGGAATESAGKVLSGASRAAGGTARLTGQIKDAITPPIISTLARPATAVADAATQGGFKGLAAIGDTLAAQGKELRTGAPSPLTTRAATAAAKGESAIGTNLARRAGDAAAKSAATVAGVTPLNVALSEGDPKAFTEMQVGAGAFGGVIGSLARNRAALVEGVRPHLRSEGARALAEAADGNDPLAAKSAAYLFSMPEAARDSALEAIGAIQGLPVDTKNGRQRAKVYVLSEPDYLAADRAISGQSAMGGGRGFFYGPDGAAYINGDYHSASELTHTIGHEFGGHAGINIMRAAGEPGGALYNGLIGTAKEALMPNGRATPEFRRFIAEYNKAFDPTGKTKRLSVNNPEAIEEFLAETAGQIMAGRGLGELALPKNIQDRLTDSIGRYLGKVMGVDTREVGTPTKFGREEVGALTQAMQETLGQIVGMKLRGRAEIPEAPKTTATRIQELQQTLSRPRPDVGRPLTERQQWIAEQKAARAELKELAGTQIKPISKAASQTTQPPLLPHAANPPPNGPIPAPTPNESLSTRAGSPATSTGAAPATAPQISQPGTTQVVERQTPARVEAPATKVVPSEAEVRTLVETAEREAVAREKNAKTAAAQKRIRDAKVNAILDAIGNDATGLRRVTDEFGNTKIVGDFDPANPLHRALSEMPAGDVAKLVDLQAKKGTPTYIRYRSAISSAEGEGGAGTLDTGMRNRNSEYDVDPAAQRNQGTIQHKVIIPIETSVTKDGGAVMRAFVPDNLLHNAESIFEGLRELGRPNPYGNTPDQQGPQLLADAQAYAENHQNGYRGDGSGPIRQFTDSNLPRPVEGYAPKVIPAERFDILNMAMHDPAASRLATLEAAQQAAVESGKEFAPTKARQLATAREAAALAMENNRFVDQESGETNRLRAELRRIGFDIADRFKSPFENLLPRHILEVSDAPISLSEGEIPTVRPTGMSVDPMKLVERGRPNEKAVRAGFMPKDLARERIARRK